MATTLFFSQLGFSFSRSYFPNGTIHCSQIRPGTPQKKNPPPAAPKNVPNKAPGCALQMVPV